MSWADFCWAVASASEPECEDKLWEFWHAVGALEGPDGIVADPDKSAWLLRCVAEMNDEELRRAFWPVFELPGCHERAFELRFVLIYEARARARDHGFPIARAWDLPYAGPEVQDDEPSPLET